jgi:hypothetical protein
VLQEREFLEARAEIEASESRLQNKDEEMSQMQNALAEAQEQAQALSQAMSQMHVKDEESDQDQEHGGIIIFTSLSSSVIILIDKCYFFPKK